MYRRVYVEITRNCNLDCSFCAKTNEKRFLSLDDFKKIIDQLEGITSSIYYHVLGEPLLHPDIFKMMEYASNKNIKNNLTTNGTLLKERYEELSNANISRVNVSLQAYFDNHNNLSKDKLEEVLEYATRLSSKCAVFLRLWDIENPKDKEMAMELCNRYQVSFNEEEIFKPNGIYLTERLHLQAEKQFIWPKDSTDGKERGFCQGLRTHIGILSDGTVIPCCLDSQGAIKLGNCLEEPLENILNNNKTKALYDSFTARKPIEPLCQKCTYKERFD